jgi:hypothetical protein
MNYIYTPAQTAEGWKQFLAEPEKQWVTGYSARTLAYCWQEAKGFPAEVQSVLSNFELFSNIKLLLGIPEHQVPLPGGSRPSQTDLWVLARAGDNLVSIAVEGKVNEPFGPQLKDWLKEASPGKQKRLQYLCDQLSLDVSALPPDLRYQLLHRAASAVIEADRFGAAHAVMLIHSFSQSDMWFQDYAAFVSLFGTIAVANTLVSIGSRSGISLHCAWVRGDAQFVTR